MKVTLYRHYLILPEENLWKDVFDSSVLEDFLHVSYYLNDLKSEYNGDDKSIYYLYAITTDPEISRMFSYSHDDKLFKVIESKMDKKEAKSILKERPECEIEFYDDLDSDTKEKFLLTYAEYQQLMEMEDYWLLPAMSYATDADYTALKDKYIKALDYLMYCTTRQLMGSESDYYSYEMSFGISAEGYLQQRASVKMNAVAVFTKLFRLVLRKET